MTHRERVIAAVKGDPTDRIPADYYGTPEASAKYIKDLGLKDETDLIRFLDTDVVRASAGAGKTSFRREKEYMRNAASAAEVRRIAENIPPLDELMDHTPVIEARKANPDHALLTYGPGSFFLGINSAFGYELSLMHHIQRPDLIEAMVESGVEYSLAVIDKLHRDVDSMVDIISLEDDYGTQSSLYISHEMFQRFYKPAFAKIIAWIKKYGYLVQFHSCGAVVELIPDLIEIGVDILDPVQVNAAGMSIESLARDFRGKICFHGGMDTQKLLPHGTPDDVRKQVFKIISLLGTTKAFICPTQFFLPDIPTENLLAMYRAERHTE